MLSSILVIVPFLVGINAANDWTVPCTSGSCSYDLPAANGTASSGTVKIWGSTDAITDITKAADWEILGCDPNALTQNIRLVCMTDPDDPNSKCAHLYQNIGAVNKLVRLPENCGASAFARISRAWEPEDQSIPSSVKRRLVRRDGVQPVVKALALDTNFDSVDWSKTGVVNIAIQAANVPGAATAVTAPAPGSRRASRSRGIRRGLGDIIKSATDGVKDAAGKVGDKVSDAAGDVKDAATAAAGDVKDAATKAGDKVEDAATKAASAVKDTATKAASKAEAAAAKAASKAEAAATKAASAVKDTATKAASKVVDGAKAAASVAAQATNNTIDVDKAFALKPLSFSKSVNLIDQSLDCGPVDASLRVDMDADATAQATITVAATGTIVPPKMTSFGIVAGLTANVAGTLTMQADLSGRLDSGKINLVTLGIPGLTFPGILTIGPSFKVDAQIVGDVDVAMDMTVGLNFDVTDAQLAFPPSAGTAPDDKAFKIGDTPLTLNADPSVQATGTITAHLIPSLNLGVNALGGKAKAQIFLALDTNAELVMSLDGSGDITKVKEINGAAAADDTTAEDDVRILRFGRACVLIFG
ncbi:hypothetical protein DFH09DRAFT_338965 [Mycena vulgaris]|nr:hypothetical protein DFH09DRAFT_338965 [Mycena vulgaris]